MYYSKFQDIKLSMLGMGNMRLPRKEGGGPNDIDLAKSQEMIDYCMAHGINYYDTAYVYNNGESERVLGECLKSYPRDKFYIADKFNYRANPDYKAVFQEQLERLQTDHIDFYLIHCLLDSNIDDYINCGAIEYFLKLKDEGKISYLGFSTHASVDTLKKFVAHHAWDFVQIQCNYFDWVFGTAAEEYKVLDDLKIPTMIMEPVRGGKLSHLTDELDAKLKEKEKYWSVSSWALRFAQSLPQVRVVLSGMSTLDHVKDNIDTFSDGEIFTEEHRELILETAKEFRSQIVVPCTACRYCTEDCPMQINIPAYLAVLNDMKVDGSGEVKKYKEIVSEGKPGDCISCYACTGHCPQSIEIPKYMAELAEAIEKYEADHKDN